MKRNISNNFIRCISLLVSVILLATSLVIPYVINAEDGQGGTVSQATAEEKAAATTELKNAWKKLENERKGEEFMYPNAILANQNAWYADDTLIESTDKYLGSYYAEIDTQKYTESPWYGRLLGYGDSKHTNASTPFCNKYIAKGVYNSKEGFYLYINAENVTSDVVLSLGLGFMNGDVKPERTYTIKSGTSGNIKITDKDFFDDFKAAIKNQKSADYVIPSIWIKIEQKVGGAKLKFGALNWSVGGKTTLPADIDTISDFNLISSAMSVDADKPFYLSDNISAFKAALEKAKSVFPEFTVAFEVRDAWANMEYAPKTLLSPSIKRVTPTDKAEVKTDMYLATNELSAEESKKFGSFYGKVNSAQYKRMDMTKDSNGWWTEVSAEGYSSLLLNIRVDSVAKEGTFKADLYTSSANIKGKDITIKSSDAGKWLTFTADDLFVNGMQGIKENNIEAFKDIVFQFSDDCSVELSVGSFLGIKYVGLPEGSENWSYKDWILKAIKLDTSGYENTAAFEECRQKAKQVRNELEIFNCSTEERNISQIDLSAYGENVLKDIKPEIYYTSGTESAEISNKKYRLLTDGDLSTEFSSPDIIYGSTDSYTDIIYKVNGRAVINKLLVAGADSKGLGEYEIYISSDKTALFNPDNRETVFRNSNASQVQTFTYQADSTVFGTYIAFRIKNPITDADAEKYIRLLELAAYGNVEFSSVIAGDYDVADIRALGKNIIAENQLTPKGKFNGRTIDNFTPNEGKDGFKYLYDCDLSTSTSIGNQNYQWKDDNGTTYLDMWYDLGRDYRLNKIFLRHMSLSWDKEKILTTGEYEVYASTDTATLFQGSSRIAAYNNRNDGKGYTNGFGDGTQTTYSQLFTFYGDGIVARYVCFRIKLPVSNWELACKKQSGNRYTRFEELGIYGEEYDKPVYDTNLTKHTPLSVYRTSAGTHTPVAAEELTKEKYNILYDGETDAAAEIPSNGKQLDYLYNLCGSMEISGFRMRTLTQNVKALKIYASLVEDQVWNESSLVYSYSDENAGATVIEKLFDGTQFDNKLKTARYVRFSVISLKNDMFDPTEIEVIGKDNQTATYRNIVMDHDDYINLYLVDKATGKYNTFSQNANKLCVGKRPLKNMIDADTSTVLDLYAGENNKQSINIVFSLEYLAAIDNISLTAGSNEKYWPSKLNYYIGTDEKDVLTSKTPAGTIEGKPENGVYSYDFIPQTARFVRLEITESQNPYMGNRIISVISEIAVNGINIFGTGEGDAVASFTDKETGIKLDILKNTDNDVFELVQGIKVVKRDPSNAEKQDVSNGIGVSFCSQVYEIFLLDSHGNTVTDIGGREIKAYFPISSYSTDEDIYILQKGNGSFTMIESLTEGDYQVITLDSPSNMCFALAKYIDEVIPVDNNTNIPDETQPEDDSFEDDDEFYDDDTYDDDTDSDEEPEEDTDTVKSGKRRKKIIKVISGSVVPYIIGGIAAVLVIGAGGTFTIIFIKKRKKKQ